MLEATKKPKEEDSLRGHRRTTRTRRPQIRYHLATTDVICMRVSSLRHGVKRKKRRREGEEEKRREEEEGEEEERTEGKERSILPFIPTHPRAPTSPSLIEGVDEASITRSCRASFSLFFFFFFVTSRLAFCHS